MTHSALDIGQVVDVFDGSTDTLARNASVNPMVVTLTFAAPIQLSRSRVWFLAGSNRWRLETADTVADLDSAGGSYALALDWATGNEASWEDRGFSAAITCRVVRLKLQRLTGDDYVHLSEWELFSGVPEAPVITQQPVSQLLFTGQTRTLSVGATGSPLLRYQWRQLLGGIFTPLPSIIGSAASVVLGSGSTGIYDVIITNAAGEARSRQAVVGLNAFAEIEPRPLFPVGSVVVELLPPGIGEAWRFEGESRWRESATSATGLDPGTGAVRRILFKPVPGFRCPEPIGLTVEEGTQRSLSREYAATPPLDGTGGLIFVIKPDPLTSPALPPGPRGQWRLLGEDDTQWRDSATTRSDLTEGEHLVECREIPGWVTPIPVRCKVVAGEIIQTSTVYYPSAAPPTGPWTLLPFETTNSPAEPYPYACIGQVRSDKTEGTGFAAAFGGVVTAAHLAFDENTLSAATGLQWLPQRQKDVFEAQAFVPSGFFLLTNYAAMREADATPGNFSPASLNAGIAVLACSSWATSGFLASDAVNNPWLNSSVQKRLVGYPFQSLQGPAEAGRGAMHASALTNAMLMHEAGETYTSAELPADPGMVGAPLLAIHTDGLFYPAGVYLGGTGPPKFRAIDSELVKLLVLAGYEASVDDNSTAGITLTSIPLGAPSGPGALVVNLAPASAHLNGGWKLGAAGPPRRSGNQLSYDTARVDRVYFSPVAGLISPGIRDSGNASLFYENINLSLGRKLTMNANYSFIATHPLSRTIAAGSNTTFDVFVAGSPTGYQWRLNNVAIPGATSFNYTVQQASPFVVGDYSVAVTWANGILISDTATLTVLPVAQTIQWTGPVSYVLENGPFNLNAAASSGLPVSFAVLSGPASLAGSLLTPTGLGLVVVRANQTGSSNYLEAASTERSITISGDTLEAWRTRQFSAGELSNPLISGPEADSDRDGINVLLEYALNLNPKVNDLTTITPTTGRAGLPVADFAVTSGPRRLRWEYVRRKATANPGISYQVQFSASPGPAGPWNPAESETTVSINDSWERVIAMDTTSPFQRRFGRLLVTKP